MAIQWSGLGPELLLQLDRGRGQPLRSQLEAGLRDAIRSGRLQGGERLPSSRELARELGVSRGLVQECYNQLLAEGYLTSRIGSATRVAAGARPAPAGPRRRRPAPPPRLIADFRSGVPDLASFPRGDWAWATREACRRVRHRGPRLRRPARQRRAAPGGRRVPAARARRRRRPRAHRRLHRVRAGAQPRAPGAGPAGRAGAPRWRTPATGTWRSATARGPPGRRACDVVPVPVDELGLDVAALDASGARAVVVTPAHQSPTGRRARGQAAARPGGVGGPQRRVRHRGRLRFRVPLRPGAGRRAAGAGAGPRLHHRHGQQVAGARRAAGLGAGAAGAGRRRRGGETGQRPRLVRPGPAGAGRAARVGPVRPAPAPHARGVRPAAAAC